MSSAAEKLLGSDHAEIDTLLAGAFAAIASSHLDDTHRVLDLFWARLAVHIRAEHLHLFSTLRLAVRTKSKKNENSGPAFEDLVEQLRADHDYFMKELAALVSATRNMKTGGSGQMRMALSDVNDRLHVLSNRLHSHNKAEEYGVYPLVDLLLSSHEAADLHRKIQHELENMPPRFAGAENR